MLTYCISNVWSYEELWDLLYTVGSTHVDSYVPTNNLAVEMHINFLDKCNLRS